MLTAGLNGAAERLVKGPVAQPGTRLTAPGQDGAVLVAEHPH